MKQTIQRCSSALTRMLLILMLLLTGSASAWGEDATMAAGTNGSAAKVNDKDAIKVGTGKAGGDMTITVPAGSTTLEFYAAAWNGVSGLSLNITPTNNVSPTSVNLTADAGISGNSPFTLSGTESSYKFTITLSNISEKTTLTLTSSTAKRFVVWGATCSSGSGDNDAPALSSIAIKTAPTKTTYTEGEKFDPAGLVITKTMSDATTEDVTYGNNTKGDFSFNPSLTTALQTSNDKVTITYGGKTVDQAITVSAFTPSAGTYDITPNNAFFNCNAFTNKPKDFTSASGTKFGVTIEYIAATNAYINESQIRMYSGTKLKFNAPSGFDLTAISFTADGTNWEGTHTASAGSMTDSKNWSGETDEVTITFGGTCRCTKITVTYKERKILSSVSIEGDATQKTYTVGDSFDRSGLTAKAHYSDGSDEDVTNTAEWAITPSGALSANITSISVTATYEGKSDTEVIDISVNKKDASITIENIMMEIHSQKDIVAETTPKNAELSYTISEGDNIISISEGKITSNAAGVATVRADYNGSDTYKPATTTFTVTVSASSLDHIAIEGVATNTTYTVGDTFDRSGLTAKAYYSDNSDVNITNTAEWTISPSGALSANINSISVTAAYEGKTDTKVIPVTVNKKTASITIANIELGIDESIDIEATTTPADAALSYTITNGSDKITLEGHRITGVEEGSATVKASYAGNETYAACEQSFTVTVNNTKTALIESFSAISGDINSDISYEAFKGNAATAPAVNSNNLRLYQNGGYVTISGIKGVKIQSVKLTTSSTYASTTVGYCVDDEVAPTVGETVAKNTEYTISDLDNQSVSIYCLGTDKDTRLEIAALKVKYTKEEVILSSIAVSGNYKTEFIQNTEFDHSGAIVTAIFSDGDEQDVTASATFSTPDMTTTGEKTVNISYTYEGDTKATSYNINVTAETVTSIALSETYQTIFREGETFTHEGAVVTATYNSGRNADVTSEAAFSTPDMSLVGNQTITVEFGGQQTSYTIIVLSANNLFYESFDTNDGTGGNDNKWSGSIASNTISTDNDGWTFASANGANKCAKFGTGNAKGSAETPEIEFSGAAEITFKAAAWNGNNEGTKLNLSATSGTLSQDSVTLSKGAWTDYTVYITGVETETQIKFEAANVSNNRFFLDEICVNQITASESVSISQYGLATCVTSSPLIFAGSGVTAYKLVVDPVGGKVILSSVAQVPAGTPILVSGEGGTHAVPVIASAEEVSTALQCSDGNATSTKDRIIYYLGVVNGSATFRPLAEGATLDAGKCYFELPSSAPSLRVEFEDEEEGNASAISSIPVENLSEATYDLLGQKNNGVKGLMIRNGKVIFIK